MLDLSQVVAGPLATQILAEQGAEVIKVEPIGGELTRVTGPDHIRGLYANCNRGKRCLAVDLATPDGVEIVLSLAERSDVVVQNFRPGVVERLGIDFDTVAARNPDVIYGSVSGFGADGPYSQRAVLDPVVQGLVGIVHGQVSESLPFPTLSAPWSPTRPPPTRSPRRSRRPSLPERGPGPAHRTVDARRHARLVLA